MRTKSLVSVFSKLVFKYLFYIDVKCRVEYFDLRLPAYDLGFLVPNTLSKNYSSTLKWPWHLYFLCFQANGLGNLGAVSPKLP